MAASARPLADQDITRLRELAARRQAGEPTARIIGEKEFWSLSLVVTPAVLVPRPETETVVELALALIDRDGPRSRTLRIADLATGSGAILLALLSELPDAFGVGTDIATDALAVARRNAGRLGQTGRAAFVACHYGAALGTLDLVVANPPYVAHGEIAALAPEVRDHDPHRALDGGPDGLEAYRTIAADARRLLAPGAHLVVEIGAGQEHAVTQLFAERGLVIREQRSDLAGMARALAFRPA